MKNKLKFLAAAALAVASLNPQNHLFAAELTATTYHTTKVDGLNIFYREAGEPSHPTIVLLHGFPSSSHMYRNLIPKLAVKYHVIAPDYTGFGYSDQPAFADFAYTFDHLAAVTDDLLDSLKLERNGIYIQDYGSRLDNFGCRGGGLSLRALQIFSRRLCRRDERPRSFQLARKSCLKPHSC